MKYNLELKPLIKIISEHLVFFTFKKASSASFIRAKTIKNCFSRFFLDK
jgi:hypothetical protein